MSRDFFIPGPVMVQVKGPAGSLVANLSQLGLSEDQVRVSPTLRHQDIMVNAWGGGQVPAETQVFLADATVSMNLVHFDPLILDECIRLSMGAPTTVGMTALAGTRLGNNAARFAANNLYVGLNLTSPVSGKPWRFYYAYIMGSPVFPLGTERQVASITWRVIPYTNDPWGGGTANPGTSAGNAADDNPLWDNQLDT